MQYLLVANGLSLSVYGRLTRSQSYGSAKNARQPKGGDNRRDESPTQHSSRSASRRRAKGML